MLFLQSHSSSERQEQSCAFRGSRKSLVPLASFRVEDMGTSARTTGWSWHAIFQVQLRVMAVFKPRESSTKVRISRSVDDAGCCGIRSLLITLIWCALPISIESLAFPSCLRVAQCESVVRTRDMKPLVCPAWFSDRVAKAAIMRWS